jgi:uncharacterized protein YprB with RNaseH-like and TPR domain
MVEEEKSNREFDKIAKRLKEIRDTIEVLEIIEKNIRDTIKVLEIIEKNIRDTIKELEIIEREIRFTITGYEIIERDIRDTIKKYEIIEREIRDTIKELGIIEREIRFTITGYEIIERDIRDTIKKYEIIERNIRDKIKEYEVAEEKGKEVEENYRKFISILLGSNSREYQEAEKLKQKLIEKYEGMKLEDVIEGEELKTPEGVCYHIESQEIINLKIINPEHARKKILSNLKLIKGIGDETEHRLKENGYKTIDDLTEHPRFGSEAKRFLDIIDRCDASQIIDWIGHRFSKSHPLILYSSGLLNKEDFIIFDIETRGLFGRNIILFGVARISGNHILINQYLLRDIKEEPAALTGFLSHIDENSVFITFNGRTFDVPYIRERLAYYGMRGDLEKPHFDILYFSRRAWKGQFPDCSLYTLEKYLFGIERKDDVPSDLVPEFYETYRKSKNIGPLIPIIEHNKQDLVTLAKIFSKLHEELG